MMKKRKMKKYVTIWCTYVISLLLLFEFIQKLFGYHLKTGESHVPFTWDEILQELPTDAVIAMICSFFIVLIFYTKDNNS